jgi:putative oxidoreductase
MNWLLVTGRAGVDVGLLVTRLGLGFMFAYAHGWGKITAGPAMWEGLGKSIGSLGVPVFLPVFWGFMAAFSEFVGAIMLGLGLFHRVAAFLLLSTMVVATAMHATEAIEVAEGMTQAQAAWEHFQKKTSRPLEMAIIFAGLMIIGPGRVSADHLIARQKA